MNFQVVRVVPFESNHSVPIIQISQALAKKLKLPLDINYIEVQCSRNTIPVHVVCIKDKDFMLKIDLSIQRTLLLFEEERSYLITYDTKQKKLHIGPVIALLTEIAMKEEQLDLKSIHSFCIELANYSEDIGVIFYVFSLPKQINEKSMEGFIFENDAWNKSVLPFPQVVHNRLHKRTNEKGEMFQQFIQQLHEWNIPYFNDHFLNKWTTHEQLYEAEHLRPYLPETALYSPKLLSSWFEKYPVLFLKPVNGSQGKQIFKITKNADGYSLSYSSLQQEVSTTYSTLSDLYKRLASHIKKKRYIIQQGLDLFDLGGRPVDFRYLCHRGENNRWRVTSSTARASKSGYFVSNLAQGGEMLSINSVLESYFAKKEKTHLRKHLKELAIEVANEIGIASEGIFGELGIDLALDKTGRPWIIEVNTKPSKNLDSTSNFRSIRPSAKAIILYCLYLISENVKEA